MSLMPPSPTCSALIPYIVWVCALKHLVPSWQGPCTHKDESWSRHLAEDVQDPADGIEDPGDGPEDLTEVGEALDGLKKH